MEGLVPLKQGST